MGTRSLGIARATGLAISMVFAVATTAAAQDESAEDRAFRLFQESVEQYRQGRFEVAAELLEEAYELDADPVLIYNLARAYEGMGDFARSVEAYEQYLRQVPEAPDRGAIEARLQTLRREAAESQRHQAGGRRPARSGGIMGPLPYFLLGLGAAAVGVGALFGVLSNQAHQDALDATDFTSAFTAQEDAEAFAAAANVSFVVGGAILLSGAAWLGLRLLTGGSEDPAAADGELGLGAALGPGGAGLSVSRTW